MSDGERDTGVSAKLEGAFAVRPDAIFALTVLLDGVPHYDMEVLSELFAHGSANADLKVTLLGHKTEPERFLCEVARGDSRAYLIVRFEPYGDESMPGHMAHAGIWPGSTMSPRLLAELRDDSTPRDSLSNELALMSHMARRLIDQFGVGLVLNRADGVWKTKEQSLQELGVTESEHLPFAAWLDVRQQELDGRAWMSARGYEPFGLPDVSVLLPDPNLEIPTRAGLLYACHFLLGHPDELPTHLPDRFEVSSGGAIRLGDSCSFVPVKRAPGEGRWDLRLVPAHLAR